MQNDNNILQYIEKLLMPSVLTIMAVIFIFFTSCFETVAQEKKNYGF